MGQKPEEILKEIDETREALGKKIDLFADQMRDSVDRAKSKGVRAAGIAAGVLVALFVGNRIRRR